MECLIKCGNGEDSDQPACLLDIELTVYMYMSIMGSILRGRNLLLREQILSFKN